jgi:predicted deacylase
MKIAGVEIAKGQNKEIKLFISKLISGIKVEVPIIVSRGLKDGPVLLLMAGLHGDEINSVDVIRQIIKHKLHHVDAGTVICVPILNVIGFINFSREVPDGKDVNRSFPGFLKGSMASQIAYHLTQSILPVCDYAIDFHTGGKSRFNTPQVRTTLDNKSCRDLAEAFNAPYTLHSNTINKSLRETAIKKGITIIVYEGGESLRFNKEARNIAITGIKNTLNYLKMRQFNEVQIESKTCLNSSWFRAPTSGFFHPLSKLGEKVESGQVFGTISGPFGDYQDQCIATKSGYIISLNKNPMANRGDAIVQIAY